jgi:hypothetical protein
VGKTQEINSLGRYFAKYRPLLPFLLINKLEKRLARYLAGFPAFSALNSFPPHFMLQEKTVKEIHFQ